MIINSNNDGIIQISGTFSLDSATNSVDWAPTFENIGDEYTLSFTNLEKIENFTKFNYEAIGLMENRYLNQYYRVSRDSNNWTEWFDLNMNISNFPIVDPLDPLFIDIKWKRLGSSNIGTIRLINYILEGNIKRDVSSNSITINSNESKIIKPPFIFKVFKIDDIEIIPNNISNNTSNNITIKYRYSQDHSRTWSNWEFLTKENITTKRISPIRFFQIEYLIENNSNVSIYIQDINLVGNFQNVTNDYQKTNLYGIRECCQSELYGTYDSNGNFIPNTNLNSATGLPAGESGGAYCDINVFSPMSDENKANLYQPYAQNTATNLLQKLSTDAQEIFGHEVIYFATDPDKFGEDYILNEYQLYNVVCENKIKVSVQDNNFPDSQIVMNQFDLNLFETMEVHITKQQFKQSFGVTRRPAKEDFMYFCNLNRMYQVEHAQQFRNFNNSAIYYKLILKKFNKKSNVIAGDMDILSKMESLTSNSTLKEVMGFEIEQDKASVTNKKQFVPLSRDPIRLEYLAQIDKELIENAATIVSKSNYDLASVNFGSDAIRYRNMDPILKVSDNIGYSIWFNINNFILNETYNFFNFYDATNQLGWKVDILNDQIIVTLNANTYIFNIGSNMTSLNEETWYCYVLNIDQRNREMSQYIYKRNVEDEDEAPLLTSNILKLVYKNQQNIEIFEYNINETPKILGSDMKVTNIRLFSDIITESEHNKILNHYIIGDDSKHLIFADNATNKLELMRFPYNE